MMIFGRTDAREVKIKDMFKLMQTNRQVLQLGGAFLTLGIVVAIVKMSDLPQPRILMP
jgi:hypothetical protein